MMFTLNNFQHFAGYLNLNGNSSHGTVEFKLGLYSYQKESTFTDVVCLQAISGISLVHHENVLYWSEG